MAIKPVDNESFYREVDEELRRDQMRSWWDRYGKLAMLGIVLLLAAIGGYIWWQDRQEKQAGAQGQTLIEAFEAVSSGNKAGAQEKLDQLAASDLPGYRAAALITKADLAIEANDLDGAAKLFQQIADGGDYAKPYRELATVRMTALQFDKLPPQAVVDRLKPLAVPESAWFGSAGEMVAISYLKLNRPQDAAGIFAQLAKDRKVPESIRARAVQMAGSLGVDAIEDPASENQEGTQ
ncbi:MAG: tetratricopeptide repeat protein [Allosphingosinicella sp.]